jgi:hypothetical protein
MPMRISCTDFVMEMLELQPESISVCIQIKGNPPDVCLQRCTVVRGNRRTHATSTGLPSIVQNEENVLGAVHANPSTVVCLKYI